jgi:hypothetical protein
MGFDKGEKMETSGPNVERDGIKFWDDNNDIKNTNPEPYYISCTD